MNKVRVNIVGRRLGAFAFDCLIIALWMLLLFGVIMLATGGNPSQPDNAWTMQATSFLAMTLPVTLYFGLLESSRWRASLGKRVAGLAVSRQSGGRMSFARAFVRNLIKFVPWMAGHTVAWQTANAGFPGWVWGPAIVAMVVPAWWLVTLIATGQTPYDRWVGARVTRSIDDARKL